jgi:hypothetical protein
MVEIITDENDQDEIKKKEIVIITIIQYGR